MIIYGLDFTSAPRRAKPITCARCTLTGHRLRLEGIDRLESLDAFESFLRRGAHWTAGLDFPFGQPRALLEALGWPLRWADYVSIVEGLTMTEFETLIARYRDAQPKGHKHPGRAGDALARARSPLTLYRVPVGRMFFRGAPCLLRSGVSVLPCRPNRSSRRVVEAYPALAARRILGRRSYKSDARKEQTVARAEAREALVDGLASGALGGAYELCIRLSDQQAAALYEDASGDLLDAVLCAMQAAWSWRQGPPRYGVPPRADRAEGWIVDPATRPV